MIRRNQKMLNRINMLSDGVLIFASYVLASWLWLDVVRGGSRNMAALNELNQSGWTMAVLYAAWTVFVLLCMSVYRRTRVQNGRRELMGIVLGNAVSILLAASALFVFRLEDFSRGVLGLFYIFSCASLCLKRMVLRTGLNKLRRKGYNQKHVVVVGGGDLAKRFVETVQRKTYLGIQVDCVVSCQDGQSVEEMKSLLEYLLHDDDVDEVVVALEISEADLIAPVISICEKCGTKTSVIPFYNDVIPTQPTVEKVGRLKLIQLRTTPLDDPFYAMIKRGMDIIGSLVLILLTSPVMLVAAVGIKLTSPGPILFKQERVGLNKKNFIMYKFRSMRVNDEETTGWSAETDNRRTKFGSLLRKTSLDELPQFFNVLRGDMSLVGPRPEIPYYVEQFRESVPLYMVKYQVRPGITGWAQINGLRGDTSIPDRVSHDLWYIENWSFSLDVEILFRTVFGGMINAERLD